MTCPSCSCQDQNACGCTTAPAPKKSLFKRAFAKYFSAKDANGCDVVLKGDGMAMSDGNKVWMSDGSNDKPIKLKRLQQLTEAFRLMGITCDGIIGQVASESEEPKYLQISSAGLSEVSDQRSDVIYDPSKIEKIVKGQLAIWQADGVNYRLSRLQGPDENSQCCDSKYYLSFDCSGASEYKKAIEDLSDLIYGTSNEGCLVLFDGCNGKKMVLEENKDCVARWNMFFTETTESVELDCPGSECKDIQVVTRKWHKTKDIRMLEADVSESIDGKDFYISTLEKDGDCVQMKKLQLTEGQILIGDSEGKITKVSRGDLFKDIQADNAIVAGAQQLMEPVVLAVATSTIDLSAILTVPICSGTLWGLFEGTVQSSQNSTASVSVNGVVIASIGSGSNVGMTNSSTVWVKISSPESVAIVISSTANAAQELVPSVRLTALSCQ